MTARHASALSPLLFLMAAAPLFGQAAPGSARSSGPGPGTQAGPQRQTPPARPAARTAAFQVRGFADVEYTGFAAADTFRAVLGSSSGPSFGGGVQVAHRRGYFFQANISRFSADGERVFVYQGEVFKLGIPLNISVIPVDFTGGYRFVAKPPAAPRTPPAPRPPTVTGAKPGESQPPPAARRTPGRLRRWVPYAGGGVGLVSYREESDFSQGEDVSDSFTSYHVLGGIDVPLTSWVGIGGEAAYRWVPNALGDAGASKEYAETDLGGFGLRLRVTIGR